MHYLRKQAAVTSLSRLRDTVTLLGSTGVLIHQQRSRGRASVDHLALRRSEERFRLAFDHAPVGLAEFSQTDDGLVMTRMNRAAATVLGVHLFDTRYRGVDDLMAVADGEPLSRQLMSPLGEDCPLPRREIRLRRPDGSRFWGLVQAVLLPAVTGRRTLLLQISDISEDKSRVLEMTQLARRDPLTGLPNRVAVLDRLEEAITAAATDGRRGSVLFCDLDNFKQVNDRYGHLVGDQVLSEVADRLGKAGREADTVGRFGGDEFVMVAYPLTLDEAWGVSNSVQDLLAEPMVSNGIALRLHVTIGIAEITGHDSALEVLCNADADMYAMRSRSRRIRSDSTA